MYHNILIYLCACIHPSIHIKPDLISHVLAPRLVSQGTLSIEVRGVGDKEQRPDFDAFFGE
jgi:hypothetical protein